MLAPWKESYDKTRQHIKKQKHHFANKGTYSQGYCFSRSHIWMWELDRKKGWVPKNWQLNCDGREKILESLLDIKESKPVNPKGNQHWIVIGRTDAEADTLASLKVLSNTLATWRQERLTGKDPDTGKDWGQEEKGVTEDEMVGWHHWFNGLEFEQTLGDNERQVSLACCRSWGHKQLDMTWQLNNTNEQWVWTLTEQSFLLPILAQSAQCDGSGVLWSESKKQPTHPQKSNPFADTARADSLITHQGPQGTFAKVRPACPLGDLPRTCRMTCMVVKTRVTNHSNLADEQPEGCGL